MGDGVDLHWGEHAALDVSGIRLHTEVAGPDDGATIAALHGFTSGTFTWAGVAPAWASRYRVVAWDRPPFGRSDRPRPPRPGDVDPYGLDVAIGHAHAVLNAHRAHTSPGPLVLVGHSAGTVVATELVRRGTVAADALVLISPALDAAPPALVRRLFALPGAGTIGAAGLKVAVRGSRVALRRLGEHGTPLMEATGAATARSLRQPGTAEALVHMTRTWTRPALLDDLGPLGVPTLVIAGADDRIAAPESSRRLAERLDATFVLLDDVGHAPHEQVPDVVAPLMADFIAGAVGTEN